MQTGTHKLQVPNKWVGLFLCLFLYMVIILYSLYSTAFGTRYMKGLVGPTALPRDRVWGTHPTIKTNYIICSKPSHLIYKKIKWMINNTMSHQVAQYLMSRSTLLHVYPVFFHAYVWIYYHIVMSLKSPVTQKIQYSYKKIIFNITCHYFRSN